MNNTMNNTMNINGHCALIQYDPETELFRGEFIGLNGGADFYAGTVAGLHQEGEASLKAFLEVCKEQGIEPYKHYSGRFNIRISPEAHQAAAMAAAAQNISLNEWVSRAVNQAVETA